MRLFVALDLPDAERQKLFEATAPLRTGRYPFRWLMPESVHLTLRFLGEVSEERANDIARALEAAADRHARFAISVGGVGAFPSLRRPRVIWVGVNGGEALLALQDDVERSLVPLGFEPERRAWSPHLTIGRAESRARPGAFTGLAAIADSMDVEAIFEAESIDLMRSHLGRGGARYERIARAALRGSKQKIQPTREAPE